MTRPCTCGVRRAVAQLAHGLIVEVGEALEEGVMPSASDSLAERILCSALALGSEQLAHFLLAADDDQELWKLTDEEVVADAGVTTSDLQLLSVCRAWWRWLHELRLAAQWKDDEASDRCQVLLASMPRAWFAHASTCAREQSWVVDDERIGSDGAMYMVLPCRRHATRSTWAAEARSCPVCPSQRAEPGGKALPADTVELRLAYAETRRQVTVEIYNALELEVSAIASKRGRVTSWSDDERTRVSATRTSLITLTAAPGDAA